MAASYANAAKGTGTTASPTIAFPGAVTAGSTLVIAIQDRTDETTTITSVTDSVNGAWTLINGPFDNPTATTQRTWLYYFKNTAAGTPTVTVNFSGAINSVLCIVEATGVDTSAPLGAFDATPATANNSAAYATNAIVPSRACIVFSFASSSGNQTFSAVGGGATDVLPASARAHLLAIANAGSSISMSATYASSTGFTANIVSFLEPAAGGNVNLLSGKFEMKLGGKL